MSDFRFNITKVLNHAGALAERTAVLRSICSQREMTTDSAVEDAVHLVMRLWRRRCNQLREAQWGPAVTKQFQYMRNCPPVSVVARPETARGSSLPCNIAGACPWCWGRAIVKRTFDAVLGAMEATGSTVSTGVEGAYPFRLAVYTRSVRVPGFADPAPQFSQVSRGMDKTKTRFKARSQGFVQLGVVSPGKAGWVVSHRFLGLFAPDAQPPKTATVIERPTKRKIAAAVARFARYPVGMLRGEIDPTVLALDRRLGFKLLRFAGCLHGGGSMPGDADGSAPGTDRFLDL